MIRINQYQDLFFLNNIAIKIDYLKGKMVKIYQNEKIQLFNSKRYSELENIYFNKLHVDDDNLRIVLIPTYSCNMDCIYCYESLLKTKREMLDNSVFEGIVKLVKRNKIKKVELVFLGGEPIQECNIRFFSDFISVIKSNKINCELMCISNGLQIPKFINEIVEWDVKTVQLTMDGLNNIHNSRRKSKVGDLNSFECLCKSVDLLLEHNISVNLRINIDKYNLGELNGIANLIIAKKWNVHQGFFSYVYPITYGYDDYSFSEKDIFQMVVEEFICNPKLYSLFELDFHGVSFVNGIINHEMFVPILKFCSSCSNQIVIDSDKNIYTCWWGAAKSEFKIGELSNGIIKLHKRKLLSWKNHSVDMIYSCKKCKYKFICGGGCVFKAFDKHHNLNSGNCSDFYDLIKLYLTLDMSKKDLAFSLEFVKNSFLKNFIFENKVLLILSKGTSMLPVISPETVIRICYKQKYDENDIVLYESSGKLKLHRIVSMNSYGYAGLKGDNEEFVEYLHVSDILGVVGEETYEPVTIIYKKMVKNVLLTISIVNSYLSGIEVESV